MLHPLDRRAQNNTLAKLMELETARVRHALGVDDVFVAAKVLDVEGIRCVLSLVRPFQRLNISPFRILGDLQKLLSRSWICASTIVEPSRPAPDGSAVFLMERQDGFYIGSCGSSVGDRPDERLIPGPKSKVGDGEDVSWGRRNGGSAMRPRLRYGRILDVEVENGVWKSSW